MHVWYRLQMEKYIVPFLSYIFFYYFFFCQSFQKLFSQSIQNIFSIFFVFVFHILFYFQFYDNFKISFYLFKCFTFCSFFVFAKIFFFYLNWGRSILARSRSVSILFKHFGFSFLFLCFVMTVIFFWYFGKSYGFIWYFSVGFQKCVHFYLTIFKVFGLLLCYVHYSYVNNECFL